MVSLSVLLLNFWHVLLAAVCFNNHRLKLSVFLGWFFSQAGKSCTWRVFSPRDAKQSAVLLRQFVCPSVCLSVTLRYRGHISWNTLKIISWLISLYLCLMHGYRAYYKGNTQNCGRNRGGVDNLIWISSYSIINRFQCIKKPRRTSLRRFLAILKIHAICCLNFSTSQKSFV